MVIQFNKDLSKEQLRKEILKTGAKIIGENKIGFIIEIPEDLLVDNRTEEEREQFEDDMFYEALDYYHALDINCGR